MYHLNNKLETIESREFNLVKRNGRYGIKGDTLRVPAWRAGFALKAYDLMQHAVFKSTQEYTNNHAISRVLSLDWFSIPGKAFPGKQDFLVISD